MKKLVVLLLAFAVAAGAFAQAAPAVTIGNYLDVVATPYSSDTGNTGYAAYTETYLNYSNGPFAWSATAIGSKSSSWVETPAKSKIYVWTESTATGAWDMLPSFRNYKMSYKIIPEVTVMAGRLREGPARLASYVDGNGFSTRLANSTAGVMVQAAPVAGLTAAAFVPMLGGAVATDFGKANFGASYAVPNLVTAVAGYRLENKELYVGADVKAVKGLVAKVGFLNNGGTSKNYIYATAGSSSLVKGVNVGVDADYNLTDSKFGVRADGKVAVAKDIQACATVTYDNGDDWYGKNAFQVQPYLQAAFGPGTIYAGVLYNSATGAVSIPLEFEAAF